MTLKELYEKVIADDGLKEEFAKAANEGDIVEWAAEQGVVTTQDEIVAFLQATANEKISLDSIDAVAGGDGESTHPSTKYIVTIIIPQPTCIG